jgi:hypothetical protein
MLIEPASKVSVLVDVIRTIESVPVMAFEPAAKPAKVFTESATVAEHTHVLPAIFASVTIPE